MENDESTEDDMIRKEKDLVKVDSKDGMDKRKDKKSGAKTGIRKVMNIKKVKVNKDIKREEKKKKEEEERKTRRENEKEKRMNGIRRLGLKILPNADTESEKRTDK